MRLAQADEVAKSLKTSVQKIDKQIEQLLDRIVEASNSSVVAAYENRISKLEQEKFLTQENIENEGKPRHTQEELFELAFKFLSSPWNIWKNNDLAWKKTVLRLAFVEPISYSRNEGVRTPKIATPFKALEEISCGEKEMAHLRGVSSNTLFDTLAQWNEVLKSIQNPANAPIRDICGAAG